VVVREVNRVVKILFLIFKEQMLLLQHLQRHSTHTYLFSLDFKPMQALHRSLGITAPFTSHFYKLHSCPLLDAELLLHAVYLLYTLLYTSPRHVPAARSAKIILLFM
jgi:hypothetical protein